METSRAPAPALQLATLAGVRLNLAGLHPVVHAAVVDGSYEAPERHALAATLQPGDTVLELGTGLGLISTLCAQRIGSQRLHTFEANPALEPRIRETWALNDEIRRIDPSVLVMDIEGGEAELLRVADLHRIERIVAEFQERMLGRAAIDTMVTRLYAQLPAASRYALVDGDEWGPRQVLPGRERVTFVERDGCWGGAPLDDAEALAELGRHRAPGLRAVVFGSDCGWWLTYCAEFERELERTGRRLVSDGRFDGFLFD